MNGVIRERIPETGEQEYCSLPSALPGESCGGAKHGLHDISYKNKRRSPIWRPSLRFVIWYRGREEPYYVCKDANKHIF